MLALVVVALFAVAIDLVADVRRSNRTARHVDPVPAARPSAVDASPVELESASLDHAIGRVELEHVSVTPAVEVADRPARPHLQLRDVMPRVLGSAIDPRGEAIPAARLSWRLEYSDATGRVTARGTLIPVEPVPERRFALFLDGRDVSGLTRTLVLRAAGESMQDELEARVLLGATPPGDVDLGVLEFDPPPEIVAGTWTDADGHPIAAAHVSLEQFAMQPVGSSKRRRSPRVPHSQVIATDASGAFELRAFDVEDEIVVIAWTDDGALARASARRGDRDVRLRTHVAPSTRGSDARSPAGVDPH